MALSLLTPALASAHGGGTPQLTRVPAGPYLLYVWTSPEPWRVGQAHTTVAVTALGAAGETPVTGAQVIVIYDPTDGADRTDRSITAQAVEGKGANAGFYEADAELPSAGPWRVTVQVTGPAGSGQAGFDYAVQPAQSINPLLVGGSVVLVLVALGFGGMWLRKVQSRTRPQSDRCRQKEQPVNPVRLVSRRWIIPTILIILGMIVLARLGVWQLDRMQQKRSFNNMMAERWRMEPYALNSAPLPPDLDELTYRRIQAQGTFDYEHQITLKNQFYLNAPGVVLVTPLVMDDGRAVLVARGWIPEDQAAPADWPQFEEGATATVLGTIQKTQPPRNAAGRHRNRRPQPDHRTTGSVWTFPPSSRRCPTRWSRDGSCNCRRRDARRRSFPCARSR